MLFFMTFMFFDDNAIHTGFCRSRKRHKKRRVSLWDSGVKSRDGEP
jgi:hypothetical protein